jgi:ketosteroid isomerase-like protein
MRMARAVRRPRPDTPALESLNAAGLTFFARTTRVVVSGDLAVELATMPAKFPAREGALAPPDQRGKVVDVWRRIGGEWRVLVHAPSIDGRPRPQASGQ